MVFISNKMKKLSIIISIVAITSILCDINLKIRNIHINEGDLLEFKFLARTNVGLEYDINGFVKDNIIYCIFPPKIDRTKLKAEFNFYGREVTVNGKKQKSNSTKNSFEEDVIYKLDNGESYRIICIESDIPLIEIQVDNYQEVISKEEYLDGNMHVSVPYNANNIDYRGNIEIKGRGNSSWQWDEKSYRIELDNKHTLLDMPSARDWVLISNHCDKTLMRNKLAYDLAKKMQVKYAQDSKFVNLSINGEFKGSYLLVEPIAVGKGRIEFDNYTDEKIQREYLLEIDTRLESEKFFTTDKGVDIIFKNPKKPTDSQMEYVKEFINDFESVLYSEVQYGNSYEDYININTFIDYFIISELFKNADSDFFSSISLYIDRNEKLSIGLIWDFDRGAENSNANNDFKTDGWIVKNVKWYGELFKDGSFVEKVKNRYTEIQPILDEIPKMIDSYYMELEVSQNINFIKWDILNENITCNYLVLGSYNAEVEYLKEWLKLRREWLNANLT